MLRAIVVKGEGIGAKELVPTLNLDPFNKVCWPYGVYACSLKLFKKKYDGVLHWGPKGNGEPGKNYLEVHLFDFNQDAYGEEVELEFKGMIREIRGFNSFSDLKLQIKEDIAAAKALL